ncbi:MAG: dethiobiotin synthase [Bradymonadia bacterium]|jgi:dethiobiotin synthase
MRVFITGTDTGVGKTTVSALLLSALVQAGHRAAYFKPAQTGDDDDTATVHRLTGVPYLPPTFRFEAPHAPWRAAHLAGSTIEPLRIIEAWSRRPLMDAWIVEGAGGLTVPLTATFDYRDLAAALGLPVLVVASTRLGTINHTRLTVEAARRAGLVVVGVVLNGTPDPGLDEALERLLGFEGVRVLAHVPPLPEITPALIARIAPSVFHLEVMRALESNAVPSSET